jgi:hypothetical protein
LRRWCGFWGILNLWVPRSSRCWKGGAFVALFRVRNNTEEVIGGSFDLEVEALACIHSALPNIARFAVLLVGSGDGLSGTATLGCVILFTVGPPECKFTWQNPHSEDSLCHFLRRAETGGWPRLCGILKVGVAGGPAKIRRPSRNEKRVAPTLRDFELVGGPSIRLGRARLLSFYFGCGMISRR